jgi:hypothetical protein
LLRVAAPTVKDFAQAEKRSGWWQRAKTTFGG